MLNFGNKEFRNLQEQVLKNAQDIEVLKGRQNLQPVFVDELPEVGNPNYIYLVAKDDGESPDVYDEYIWLEDEERYELIGGVSIDLTNYVTLDSEQTITGAKTFTQDIITTGKVQVGATGYNIKKDGSDMVIEADGNPIKVSGNFIPTETAIDTLGSSSIRWKTIFLSHYVDFGNNVYISKDSSNRLNVNIGNDTILKIGNANATYCKANWTPDGNDTYNLGRSTSCWKDLYLTGNISDGVNSVTVANIASKVTSTYASGTFDANGQSTIDISGGEPEGLFIFTYGNCQCFVRLTAAMVQSADVTPIRVSCPMISNGDLNNGWLAITRSGTTLTIEVVNDDLQEHVDSGYSWTLVKTNLI